MSLGFFSRYAITRERHAVTRAALDARETVAVAAPAPVAARALGSPATDPL
jgi:hypothetical protein